MMPKLSLFSGEVETGRVAVTDVPVQLPDIPCKQVRLLVISAGAVSIGNSAAVTGTTGYVMTNSLPPPIIPVGNLSQIWIVATTAIERTVEFLAMR